MKHLLNKPIRSIMRMAPALIAWSLMAADAPPFVEVLSLIRTNLVDANDADLNTAAVQGLVQQFPGRVLLTTNATERAAAGPAEPAIARAQVFNGTAGYVRVSRVEAGLAGAFATALSHLTASNQLAGLVIDLRLARGEDYAEAAKVADQFLREPRPLADWGAGPVAATPKTNAFSEPVVVLANRETAGAAEALAAILRQSQVGLVIGGRTAGHAAVFKDFPLSNGQVLRVAVAPVRIGEGQSLTPEGVVPDIVVNVPLAEEKAFLTDPFRVSSRPAGTSGTGPAATNRPARLTEADLVRMKREGLDPDSPTATRVPPAAGSPRATREPPVVTDPSLARALDLLKALALVPRDPER